MITFDEIFVPKPKCPLCGSAERHSQGTPRKETSTYVKVMCESFGIETLKLLERMEVWECENCLTNWFDPWFNSSFVRRGYGYLVGRHIYGWAAMRAWANKQSRPYFIGRPKLLDHILSLKPELKSYGEINCPFSGLAFEIRNRQHPNLDRNIIAGRVRTMREMYASDQLIRHYAKPEAWKKLGRGPTSGPLADLKTILINEDTPLCWGHSCTYSGANCRSFAHDLLFDDMSSFDALETEGTSLDAIGFFNILDHFTDPLRVIGKALKLTDLLVLECHPTGPADPQHFYSIGEKFVPVLQDQGLNAVEITDFVTDDHAHGDIQRYFLVSSSIETERLKPAK